MCRPNCRASQRSRSSTQRFAAGSQGQVGRKSHSNIGRPRLAAEQSKGSKMPEHLFDAFKEKRKLRVGGVPVVARRPQPQDGPEGIPYRNRETSLEEG